MHTSRSNRAPQATGERLLSQLLLRTRAMSVYLRLRLLRCAWLEEDDEEEDGDGYVGHDYSCCHGLWRQTLSYCGGRCLLGYR